MMSLALLALLFLFIGGCLTAVGVMGSMGSTYIAAGHTSVTHDETSSLAEERNNGRGKKRILKFGLMLLAIGIALMAIASL